MKTQKGITLIALIITIIVMLILVGVSVSVALNTGLFKTAQGVAKNTEEERVNETALSDGKITIEGKGTVDLEEYANLLTPNPTYKTGTLVKVKDVEGYNFRVMKYDGDNIILLYDGAYMTSIKYPNSITLAEDFGENVIGNDAIGRLMTLDEIEELGAAKRPDEGNWQLIEDSEHSWVCDVGCWVTDGDRGWLIQPGMKNISDPPDVFLDTVSGALRPVIEISKSLVEPAA